MKQWTFRREAVWRLWIHAVPAAAIAVALIVPALLRLTGS